MKLKFVLLLFFPLLNYAQNAKEIHGALLNENLPLSGCFVQAIGENSNYTIAFDVTNSRGEYTLTIDSLYKNIRIVVSHLEFQLIDSLVVLKKDTTYLLLNLIKKQYL